MVTDQLIQQNQKTLQFLWFHFHYIHNQWCLLLVHHCNGLMSSWPYSNLC